MVYRLCWFYLWGFLRLRLWSLALSRRRNSSGYRGVTGPLNSNRDYTQGDSSFALRPQRDTAIHEEVCSWRVDNYMGLETARARISIWIHSNGPCESALAYSWFAIHTCCLMQDYGPVYGCFIWRVRERDKPFAWWGHPLCSPLSLTGKQHSQLVSQITLHISGSRKLPFEPSLKSQHQPTGTACWAALKALSTEG